MNIYADEARSTLLAGKFMGRANSNEKLWPGVGKLPSLLIEGHDKVSQILIIHSVLSCLMYIYLFFLLCAVSTYYIGMGDVHL